MEELYHKPIQTIIEYYENLTKEKILQEYQEITPENFKQVIKHSIAHRADCYIDPNKKPKYYFEHEGKDAIFTDNFEEFLAFVQKRITLKPLPKELSLIEWFMKNVTNFTISNIEDIIKIFNRNGDLIGVVEKTLPKPQQEELILKIIEVYGGVK